MPVIRSTSKEQEKKTYGLSGWTDGRTDKNGRPIVCSFSWRREEGEREEEVEEEEEEKTLR